MKILLTGGTGFVGNAIQKKLDGHSVRITSRSQNNSDSKKIYSKTISSIEDFSDCLQNIDVVIHTAARVHQMNDKSDNPLNQFMETNCYGTINLANQAALHGAKRFIFISSIKVNGERTIPGSCFKYDDEANPTDAYGISKAEAENGLMAIAKKSNMEVVIIRPPLVYGPNVQANFQSLLYLAKKNLPLPFGSINNKRSFVALDNLVSLINICIDHPNAANKTFLVSDDFDVSTSGLLKMMAKAFNKKSYLLKINPRLLKFIGKILRKESVINRLCENLQIDITYTRNTLNWSPPISMSEGIEKCAEHIINNAKT